MQIYAYDSLSTYLKDYYSLRKRKSPGFSIQVWADQIGITSNGAFSQMINGKRKIPARFVRRLAKYLKLNDHETQYFTELYLLERSNNEKTDTSFLDKLNPLKWNQKKVTENKNILSHPITFGIKTIFDRNKLKELSFENLRTLFSSDITDDEIKEGLKTVNQCHEVFEESEGERLVTTIDTGNVDIQKIHEYYLELAKKRVKSTNVHKREFNNYSFNIKKERLPEAKEKMRFFLDSFIEEFNDNENGDEVYQLGAYLYSLLGD